MKVGYSFEGLVNKLLLVDASAVHKAGDETVAGLKTFSTCPATSAVQGASGGHLTRRDFVQAELNKKLNLTGGTIDGGLTVTGNVNARGSLFVADVNTIGVSATISRFGDFAREVVLNAVGSLLYVSPDASTKHRVYHEGFIPNASATGAIPITGGEASGKLGVGLPLGAAGFPVDWINDANHYLNRAMFVGRIGNNAVSMFGDNKENSRHMGIQVGHADVGYKNPGFLSLQPFGGSVIIGIVTPIKGALQLRNGASLSMFSGSGTYFHQYADESYLRWGSGALGETLMMSVNTSGLTVAGNATAGGTITAKSSAGINSLDGLKRIAIEAADTGAPYITTRATGEASATKALTFNPAEVFSHKRLTANEMRVATISGIRFSSSETLSGSTWSLNMGSTGGLGINRYQDGVYVDTPFVHTGAGAVNKGTFVSEGKITTKSGKIDIEGAGNVAFEFIQPGINAVIMYKPANQTTINFGRSNGGGGETLNYAVLSYDALDISGRFQSMKSTARQWGDGGVAHLLGKTEAATHSTLYAMTSKQLDRGNLWSLESITGVMAFDSLGDTAHTLSMRGQGYISSWFFRNNGLLNSPAGWYIQEDGDLFLPNFGKTMTNWAQSTFAPIYHTHTAYQGNYDVTQGVWGAIGAYVFAQLYPAGPYGVVNPGTRVAGADLRPTSCDFDIDDMHGTPLPGTWQCQGFVRGGAVGENDWMAHKSLWIRIA